MDGDVEIFYFIILCERLCGAGSAPQTIESSRRFSATRDPL